MVSFAEHALTLSLSMKNSGLHEQSQSDSTYPCAIHIADVTHVSHPSHPRAVHGFAGYNFPKKTNHKTVTKAPTVIKIVKTKALMKLPLISPMPRVFYRKPKKKKKGVYNSLRAR